MTAPSHSDRSISEAASALAASEAASPDPNRTQGDSARTQRLLDAGLVGLFSWNIDGEVLEANDTLLRMIGYTRDDLAAGRIDWKALTPPELRERDARAVAELFSEGKHVPFEKRYIRKDGARLPIIVASVFVEGSKTQGTSFVVDISAQKEAENEQARLVREQARLLSEQERLLSEQERLLSEQERLLREQERLVSELRAAGAAQRRFMQEMLASFTEGRLRLCYSEEELPPRLPLQRAPAVLAPQSPLSLRDFRLQVEEVALEVRMPESRMFDLITGTGEGAMNAVRHGGGGTGSIGVDTERCVVQIWIEDQGKGIREQDLHRATLERGWSGAESFGHGFTLLLKAVDRVYLKTGPTGTTLLLEQEVSAPEPTWFQAVL